MMPLLILGKERLTSVLSEHSLDHSDEAAAVFWAVPWKGPMARK